MELLADLLDRNKELKKLCTPEPEPFQSDDAENAQIDWDFARGELRAFKDVDMSAVYPDFWKEVADAEAENRALRRKCCKRDPTNYFFFCDELGSE
jgi:hypothetical protein